jgi:hypothetical protein
MLAQSVPPNMSASSSRKTPGSLTIVTVIDDTAVLARRTWRPLRFAAPGAVF